MRRMGYGSVGGGRVEADKFTVIYPTYSLIIFNVTYCLYDVGNFFFDEAGFVFNYFDMCRWSHDLYSTVDCKPLAWSQRVQATVLWKPHMSKNATCLWCLWLIFKWPIEHEKKISYSVDVNKTKMGDTVRGFQWTATLEWGFKKDKQDKITLTQNSWPNSVICKYRKINN